MARRQTVAVFGQYPETSNTSGNGLTYPQVPVINDALGQSNPNHGAQLGDVLIDKFGFEYVYVRAGAALAVGQVCKALAPSAGTVSATGTGGDNLHVINTNITTTIDESQVGSFLVNCNVTRPGTRLIKGQVAVGANTKFIISTLQVLYGIGKYDGDALSVAWVSTDACAVVRPYHVDVAGAGDVPFGVSLGTVTSGSRSLIQTTGLAQVLAVGSTDALAVGSPVVTAAAGVVKGVLGTPSATEAELASRVGFATQVYAGASAIQAIFLCPTGKF